ncbi:helicase-exonuclease AddAB subunit AddA [Aneurinibacillus tyrosinisolvens]|uniref:helicase-exonuclease AddAB subunit AddA n=1 Tax=Aneurinibacillus tyrosinisolvens TaxID=1443435 RepID=UPI00063F4154|nr:helicase-exonuclease AddAB subunit AddA [Aneurinibacillus tyrosinisolvens]
MKTIDKPAGTTWTDDQWEAIAVRGTNVLVAAAAGSGKTAVLVERIIRRISDEASPVDVDRLLVVTFTKAAAAEMRQRIGGALEKALASNSSSIHLRRQLTLLNRASITTLHSFCMEVLQRYYHLIDLDPSFRIADDTEARLLRQDTIDQLFEEEYGRGEDNASFYRLVDSYAGDRSDTALQNLIQRLYDFSRSHPWPDAWLDDMLAMYSAADLAAFYEQPWFRSLEKDVRLELNGAKALLEKAAEIAGFAGGPLPYLETLHEDLSLVMNLQAAGEQSWDMLYEAFQTVQFGKLKACRGDQFDKALQEKVKGMRDQVKKRITDLAGELFTMHPQQYLENVWQVRPLLQKLVGLVRSFAECYQMAKVEKGLVDFADLEHYCLQILRHEEAGPDSLLPSAASLDYRAQFAEVLVDEYQDTNMVQETIVRLVASDSENSGNLFMVGDVKQSIYRFRLAEPGLFLEKYLQYTKNGSGPGKRIDLAKNFRSRREVIDGTNFLFKQIMSESAGEIEYDAAAELVLGAIDYPVPEGSEPSVDVLLINKSTDKNEADPEEEPEESLTDYSDAEGEQPIDVSELETVQLEARLIANKIQELIGTTGQPPYQVFDKDSQSMRPVRYRDIVILLRATSQWAPVIAEEFKAYGIPAYAEVSTGYFSATEIQVMTSLLHVIDNPLQDIPLASVLRSPIVQLSAEEMAQIRLTQKEGSFYEALAAYMGAAENAGTELQAKLSAFVSNLTNWRTEARQGALSSLIWQLYRETGYYDFTGGLPGGKQRQANLRALYDRACQYEATSFRGLFRFLRFIERMQDQGGDLGAARSLGEQEDVVRIMTIHKSKGLEFPVVFVAGLAKQYNLMDLNGSFLLHKELGFGPKYVDPELRISFPTLPYAAMKRRMRLEQLAEEMRVLYVAVTRAREKLFLVGTVKNLEKSVDKWAQTIAWPHWSLPDYELVRGRTYLDWIGPCLIRHHHAKDLLEITGTAERSIEAVADHASAWSVTCYSAEDFILTAAAENNAVSDLENLIALGHAVPVAGPHQEVVEQRLSWKYNAPASESHLSKQSVSEIKRRQQAALKQLEQEDTGYLPRSFNRETAARPRFLSRQKVNAAERGTAMHTVLQQLPVSRALSAAEIEEHIARMVERELLTAAEAEAVSPEQIERFFHSLPGQKMLSSTQVRREVPFNLAIPAPDAYPGWPAQEKGEIVLVQGVIDCLFEDNGEWILLDYKTDATANLPDAVLAERYRVQLDWYARAVEDISKKRVKEKILYFFDGERVIHLNAKKGEM